MRRVDRPRVAFPLYDDGDVAMAVSASKLYRLHSSTLKRNSAVLTSLLDSAGPAHLNSQAREASLPLYYLELVRRNANDTGEWVFQKIDSNGRTGNTCLPPVNENAIDEVERSWDWLLGSFYNRQPEFDDSSLATILSGCMSLIDVSVVVGAVDQIRETVELALLRQTTVLWTSIAHSPAAWAELGRRVRSLTLFKEAVCHMVGKWHNMTDADKKGLHPDIFALCQRKFHELDIAKEAIEMRILGHYPAQLCQDAANHPGRGTYAKDIYMWMALCFFRQWFAQSISDGRNRAGPDGGWALYKQLHMAGGDAAATDAYLSHETFQHFHCYFPMSQRACNVLEANMSLIKEDVKPFVKDLFVNRTHLIDDEMATCQWLTCALIERSDLPWEAKYDDDDDEEEEAKEGDDDDEDVEEDV